MPFAIFFGRRGPAIAALLLAAACGRDGADQPTAESPANVASPAPVDLGNFSLPVPRPPLDRAALIAAAGEAASRYASGGVESGREALRLSGQVFTLRLPFGCSGGSVAAPGLAGVRPAANGARQLELAPADWSGTPWLGAGETVEHVEGFWIDRPWLLTEQCPASAQDSDRSATAVSPQTLGLAQLYDEGSSRLGRRRARTFFHTVRPGAGRTSLPPDATYQLVLSGRIGAFPDGRAIRCHATGRSARPVCVVAVEIDRIAFETAEGKRLSEWTTG